MEDNTPSLEIDFKKLWKVFVRRSKVIALAAVLAIVAAVIVNAITFTPRYQSTATLYILRQNEDGTPPKESSSADFNLALMVVNDCNHIIKSHSVLDETIDKLHLDMSYSQLRNSIIVTNPTGTRILEVSVKSDSPQQAKKIADTVCIFATENIEKAMGFKQVSLYENAIFNDTPCNRIGIKIYLMIGVLTAVFVYVVFVLMYLFDDRIKSEEDVERYFNLSVLGEIPNLAEIHKNKGNYGYYYSSYGETQHSSNVKESSKANVRRVAPQSNKEAEK